MWIFSKEKRIVQIEMPKPLLRLFEVASLFIFSLKGSCSMPLAFCLLWVLLLLPLNHYLPRLISASYHGLESDP